MKEPKQNNHHRRKMIILRSLLFLLFTLGINAFAWFVYVARARVDINAEIASWDIEFKNSNQETNDLVISVPKMFPGMEMFSKDFWVTNKGEVNGIFEYYITNYRIGNKEFKIETEASQKTIEKLKTFYPFTINFNNSKNDLNIGERLIFNTNVTWNFENLNNQFYHLDEAYNYDASLTYYELINNEYIKIENMTENIFKEKKDNLYLDKDSADSYFGTMCGNFEKATGRSCLSVKIKLLVKQKN